MSVEVALDAWRTTSCRPPCGFASETISTSIQPRSGAARKACCRPDRADRQGRAVRTGPGETPGGSSIDVPPAANSGRVPGVHQFRAFDGKADGRTIAARRLLSVERRPHHEHRSIVHVIDALFVLPPRLRTDCSEQSVIKSLRLVDVVRSDHDVAEHPLPSS